ncbi:hypothetical protein [Ramlibacter tataouinensis]|uniref:hypothetical protein n=1 Tax=Ramlibacter tataouinensis TaxID=94132 RepID=UPI0013051E4A|nr:hypothetical protein [Ramlibacter tataouinensis]
MREKSLRHAFTARAHSSQYRRRYSRRQVITVLGALWHFAQLFLIAVSRINRASRLTCRCTLLSLAFDR